MAVGANTYQQEKAQPGGNEDVDVAPLLPAQPRLDKAPQLQEDDGHGQDNARQQGHAEVSLNALRRPQRLQRRPVGPALGVWPQQKSQQPLGENEAEDRRRDDGDTGAHHVHAQFVEVIQDGHNRPLGIGPVAIAALVSSHG